MPYRVVATEIIDDTDRVVFNALDNKVIRRELCRRWNEAEAAEARAAQLEEDHKSDIENLRHYMVLADSLQAERDIANQGWSNCVIKCAALQTERDEYKRRSDEYADRMINDANTIIDLRRQLRAACNEVADDVTRLEWLQSLINEAKRHEAVISDGDLDAAWTCFREVQSLHDALAEMLK